MHFSALKALALTPGSLDLLHTPDQPIPQQQQRRLSVAVMSAPSARYMPQSSSEEDEYGEESTVHNEPEYHMDRCSTHSTPVAQRTPTRAEVANIAPRRITHPGSQPRVRTPTGPSSQHSLKGDLLLSQLGHLQSGSLSGHRHEDHSRGKRRHLSNPCAQQWSNPQSPLFSPLRSANLEERIACRQA